MNIRVDLKTNIADGSEVVFRSPADCSQVTGLVIYHTGGKTEFAFADAHGNNVGDIDHLFAENAVVKVILDVTAGMAFVQNADTNAYIERTFVKSVNGINPDSDGNVEIEVGGKGSGIYIGSGDMPEGFDVQIDPEGEILDLAALMTEDEVEEAIDKALDDFKPPASGSGIEVSGAEVGQILKVKEVDENGVPTAWETAEMPTGSGDEWELLTEVTTTEDANAITKDIEKPGYFSELLLYVSIPPNSSGAFWYGSASSGAVWFAFGATDTAHTYTAIARIALTPYQMLAVSTQGWNAFSTTTTYQGIREGDFRYVKRLQMFTHNGAGTYKAGTNARLYGRRVGK